MASGIICQGYQVAELSSPPFTFLKPAGYVSPKTSTDGPLQGKIRQCLLLLSEPKGQVQWRYDFTDSIHRCWLTSRETECPCSKCRSSQRDCVFPSRERVLTVPESYVRRLENENAQLRESLSGGLQSSTRLTHELSSSANNDSRNAIRADRLVEDSTTEHFISKLKGVHDNPTPDTSQRGWQSSSSPIDGTGVLGTNPISPTKTSYTFISLEQDNTRW